MKLRAVITIIGEEIGKKSIFQTVTIDVDAMVVNNTVVENLDLVKPQGDVTVMIKGRDTIK